MGRAKLLSIYCSSRIIYKISKSTKKKTTDDMQMYKERKIQNKYFKFGKICYKNNRLIYKEYVFLEKYQVG